MNAILITASAAFLIFAAVSPFFLAAWLLIRQMDKTNHPYNDHDSYDWWDEQ
jgi:hypothetical protein